MDLPDTLAAAAKQHGVRFVLSTDSHQPNNLAFMKYAVDLARRAGLDAGEILDRRFLDELLEGLKRADGGGKRRERAVTPAVACSRPSAQPLRSAGAKLAPA